MIKIKNILDLLFRRKVGNPTSVTDNKQKESNFMELDEKKVEEEVKVEKETETETPKEEVKVEKETETETETETPTEQPQTNEPRIEETPSEGNGISIDQVVTKDYLKEVIDGFTAKLDALFKENADLKEQLSKKDEEIGTMKDKYETKDFGGNSKQGVMSKDKSANSTFEEYSKQFM